jgi:hypothetical protein
LKSTGGASSEPQAGDDEKRAQAMQTMTFPPLVDREWNPGERSGASLTLGDRGVPAQSLFATECKPKNKKGKEKVVVN